MVMIISSFYTVYFFSLLVISWSCHADWCRVREDDPLGVVFFTLLPLLPLFIISSITYRMHERVFRAWWNFAQWWVPVIVVVTFIVNAQPHNGSFFNMDAFFNAVIIGFFYVIFVLVSLIKIVRAYRGLRK